MEEKTNRDKAIKYLEIMSRVLIILLCFFILANSLFCIEQEFYCFGKEITFYLWFLPLIILAITLEIIALSIQKKYHLQIKNSIKSFIKFLLLFLFSSFVLSIIFYTPCISRGKARDARRQFDLRQIKAAQDLFYEKKLRYAVFQKELVEEGYFSNILVDPKTKKEYTDKDGFGLEGGDKDPNTWSVQTVLGRYKYEICSMKKRKEIYSCNEKECKKEIITNSE